jgi:3-deoxy-D-manno-octulosonic-acid transferase
MLARLYRAATWIVTPFLSLYLHRRLKRGKEEFGRIPERHGLIQTDRPKGFLVWCHAASVGESLSLLPLLHRLSSRGDVAILVTTGTVTSASLMRDRLPAGAIHQYAPLDAPIFIARFLDHWRPDLVLWVESELWPNTLTALKDRMIATVLLNGRLSVRSAARWAKAPQFSAHLLSCFRLLLAQSERDAQRFRSIGAPLAHSVGNLKYAAAPLPASDRDLEKLRVVIGDRPVWLFASSHAGEDDLVRDVHRKLLARHPRLLTILVPRHPARGAEIAHQLADLSPRQRSTGGLPDDSTHFYIADTLGELGLFYRLSPIACIGGSFVPVGGHNPIEAAQLDAAILYGPRMDNFADVAAQLEAAGAARSVDTAEAVANTVNRLLTEPSERHAMTLAARTVADQNAAVLDWVLHAIAPLLPKGRSS